MSFILFSTHLEAHGFHLIIQADGFLKSDSMLSTLRSDGRSDSSTPTPKLAASGFPSAGNKDHAV